MVHEEEIAQVVAYKTKMVFADANNATRAVIEAIVDALEEDGVVALKKFGKIIVMRSSKYKRISNLTKEIEEITPRAYLRIKPYKPLREAIENYANRECIGY